MAEQNDKTDYVKNNPLFKKIEALYKDITPVSAAPTVFLSYSCRVKAVLLLTSKLAQRSTSQLEFHYVRMTNPLKRANAIRVNRRCRKKDMLSPWRIS